MRCAWHLTYELKTQRLGRNLQSAGDHVSWPCTRGGRSPAAGRDRVALSGSCPGWPALVAAESVVWDQHANTAKPEIRIGVLRRKPARRIDTERARRIHPGGALEGAVRGNPRIGVLAPLLDVSKNVEHRRAACGMRREAANSCRSAIV